MAAARATLPTRSHGSSESSGLAHLRGGEMKDVIFQGARNRPSSGMAEVVMHMIRDEVDEVEPDIEDIDSTLERIDDRLRQHRRDPAAGRTSNRC